MAYGAFVGLHTPFSVGTENFLNPDPSPEAFVKSLLKHRPNHFGVGTMHIYEMMKNKEVQNYYLSYFCTAADGGDTVSITWQKNASEYNVKIFNRDSQKELQYNQEGKICFLGPSVMAGYYLHADETNQAI